MLCFDRLLCNIAAVLVVLLLLAAPPAWGQHSSSLAAAPAGKRYEPKWESLDSRPNPAWFDDEKIGIFIVWGV